MHDTDAIFGANVLHPWSRRRVHHALMSGALPKRELLWHMRRVAATPPYAGKLTPTWAAQVGLSGGYDRTHQCPSSLLGTTLCGPHDRTGCSYTHQCPSFVLGSTHRGPPCTAGGCCSHQCRVALTAANRGLLSASD